MEAQYSGEVSEMALSPITTSFLTGFLTPVMREEVNQVNAPMVAKERGIVISETKVSKGEAFTSLLRYKITAENDEHVVEGTLFGKTEPRMCRYGAHRGEFDLSGELLLIDVVDKPGIIGKVGTILGDMGINVSHFQFARREQGGAALLFLNTDSRADDNTVDALKALDHVLSIRRLTI